MPDLPVAPVMRTSSAFVAGVSVMVGVVQVGPACGVSAGAREDPVGWDYAAPRRAAQTPRGQDLIPSPR